MDAKTKAKINRVKNVVLTGEVQPYLKKLKARKKAARQRAIKIMMDEIAFERYRATRDW